MPGQLLVAFLTLIFLCLSLGCESNQKIGQPTKGGVLHNYVKDPIDRAKNTKSLVEERQKAGPAQIPGADQDE